MLRRRCTFERWQLGVEWFSLYRDSGGKERGGVDVIESWMFPM